MIKDMVSIYILPDNQQLQFLSNSLTLQVIHLIEYKIATEKKRKAYKKNKPAPNGNEWIPEFNNKTPVHIKRTTVRHKATKKL